MSAVRHIQVIRNSEQGHSMNCIFSAKSVEKLCVLESSQHSLLFASLNNKDEDNDELWNIRIWDLQTGKELTLDYVNPHPFKIPAWYDKRIWSLTVSNNVGDSVRMAFASRGSIVRVATIKNTALTNELEKPQDNNHEEWHIPYTALSEDIRALTSEWVSGELLLAAGSGGGHLVVWNFLSGEIKSSRSHAHIGDVFALSFHILDKQEILVSGGYDKTLRFWNLELCELFSIELDEIIMDFTWVDVDCLAVGTYRGVLTFQFNYI